MAKKKSAKASPAAEIRKLFEAGKLVIGAERAAKLLKQGKIEKVFIASNCRGDVKEDMESYARISKAELVQLDIENDELGIACKKPFSISVVGVVKGK